MHPDEMPADPRRYYSIERFLFEEVTARFREQGHLAAFDFFAIVIWKANRAKGHIARRLMRRVPDLDQAAITLTSELRLATTPRERLRILMKTWGLRLPMASAVLTVLWPEEFTVYDIRVCDELGRFHGLGSRMYTEGLWQEYEDYISAVRAEAPEGYSLRDADRYLWGRSAMKQLSQDIRSSFGSPVLGA